MGYWIKSTIGLLLLCEVMILGATYLLLSKTFLVLLVVGLFVAASIVYMMYKQYKNTIILIDYYRFQHKKDVLYYAESADLKYQKENLSGVLIISERGMTFLYQDHSEEKELFFSYDVIKYDFKKNLYIDVENEHYMISITHQKKAKEALEKRKILDRGV